MGWKLWKRNKTADSGQTERKAKLPAPRDLPQQIGQYLVLREKLDPDWVWALKCVLRPHADHKYRFDFRVFSPNAAHESGIHVVNYNSLETHPVLVLYTGWFDKRSSQIEIQKGEPPLAA